MRTFYLFIALSQLFVFSGCADSPIPRDDDDDTGDDDDDSGGKRIVEAPGRVILALASAADAQVLLDLDAPVPDLSVRLRDCDSADTWHELVMPEEVNPNLAMSIALPPMERGSSLCGLELSFGHQLEIEGTYELDGEDFQPFLLLLEVKDLLFELDPIEIEDEDAVALIVQVGQDDWITPQQIGYPPEPEREGVYVVGGDHSAYNSFLQQIETFSDIFFDVDGDGTLGDADTEHDTRPGAGLRGPEGKRFGAFGPSVCLDEEGDEDATCANAELHVPVVYSSLDEGVSWQRAESPKMAVPTEIQAADYGGGLYLAVGGADTLANGQADQGVVLSSVDAESWGAWLVDEPLTGVTFANAEMGWVAVSATGATYLSRNGVAWKASDNTSLSFEVRDVDWSTAGFFVAVGDQGKWAWAAGDGQWTEDVVDPSSSLLSFRKVSVTSEGNVLVVGDNGLWLELENPSEVVAGLAPANWVERFVAGSPNLTDITVYSDVNTGETAVAVGPDMSVPVLVTQTVGGLDVSVPPQLTELGPGVQAAAIAIMDDRCFTIAGEAGLSSWLDSLLSDFAAVPHSDVAHSISVVLTGGE